MLSEPKKLRTRDGFGYLVSWLDRFRNLDGVRAQALSRRLLAEPGNLAAIREALGRPDATEDEVFEWLAGALGAGSIVALRTRRRAPVFDQSSEVDWRELVGPDERDVDEDASEITWLELAIVDERGEGVPGIAVRLASGERADTDGKGIARFENVPTSFGRAFVHDAAGLREVMRSRWAEPLRGDWIEPEPGASLTISGLEDPLPEFALQGRTRHLWVLQPRIERVRIVGNVFDLDKAFVLPEALPLLRDVVSLYGSHEGATFVVAGHTDTSGEREHNLALSLDRARAVRAYLTDDVDTWLSFYESAGSEAQRWGAREDDLLLEQGLWRLGIEASSDQVRSYQEARGLQVDGDLGPDTRRALVTDYMSLDGATAPAGTSIVVRGYGEEFPLSKDGESLDVDPPDGVEDPTDRRVEIYVFDAPLGVLPEVEHPEAYATWRDRSRRTHDMLVVRPQALAVRVIEETSGVPVRGAAVSLVGVGLLGAGRGGATDAFGVRAFLGVGAGHYHVRAEKEGFVAASGEHRVEPGASAAVVTLGLVPIARVSFALGVRDPAGVVIPLPAGGMLTLEHEGGPALQAPVGEGGLVTFEAARRDGSVKISLEFSDSRCLLEAPNGERRMVTREDGLAASQGGARFIQLPQRLELGDPFLVLAQNDGTEAVAIDGLIARSQEGAVPLEIAPVWEHVVFRYLDRHYRRFRTVPGPTGVGEATLVMTGHPQGAKEAVDLSAWPVVRDGRTVHALAWFLPEGGFPLESDLIRMKCPARTYVSALRNDAERIRLLTVEEGAPLARHIEEPHPDRLLFYDLPEAWECDRYFGRRATDEDTRPYTQLARQTAASSPIVVSLDDVVVMRATDSGGREVVALTRDFTIFDAAFEVYKPNEREPVGYGEPYFTDPERLQPRPGRGGVPAFLVLDPAPDMRALVHGDVFEVFDARTTSEDGEVPVGARVAFSPFAASAPEDAEGWASKFCRVERRYRIPSPTTRPEFVRKGTEGACSAALFRCVGSESGREDAMMLQYAFVAFDFSPSGSPPPGGKRLDPPPTLSKQNRLVAQSLHLVHARWSGRALEGAQAVFEHGEFEAQSAADNLPVSVPCRFDAGDDSFRCGYAAFFFRREGKSVDLALDVWGGNFRASVGVGDGRLKASDLGVPETTSTLCHELGHVLGLPDEYVERLEFGSLELPGFDSPGHVPGGVYSFDAPAGDPHGGLGPGENRVAWPAMMEGNVEVRPRYIALLMSSLLRRAGVDTTAGRWRRGVRSFKPLRPAHDLPGAVPDYFRRTVSSGDAYLYVSGPGGFPSVRFHRPGSETAAVVVVEYRVAFTPPPDANLAAQKKLVKSLERHLLGVASSISCWCTLEHAGNRFESAVVFAPRYLSTVVPAAVTSKEREKTNLYLATIDTSRHGDPGGIPPLMDSAGAAEFVQRLKSEISDSLERVEARRTELDALERDSDSKTIDVLVKRDQLRRAEEQLENQQAQLILMQAALDPGRALTSDVYARFVDAITKLHPAHLEVSAVPTGKRIRPLRTGQPLVYLPNAQSEADLARFRGAVLTELGLSSSEPSSTELASMLASFFRDSPFSVVGVSQP